MNSSLEPAQPRAPQPARRIGGPPARQPLYTNAPVLERRLVEPACEVRDVANCRWFIEKRYSLKGEDPGIAGTRKFMYESDVTGQRFYASRPLGAE